MYKDLLKLINLSDLVNLVSSELRDRHLTLASAESCTGGLIASAMTGPSGASGVFVGGIVAYTNEVKMRLLRVSSDMLKRSGAVSLAVAQEMAVGAFSVMGANIGVSTTGIAGPNGDGSGIEVGTVCIGLAGEDWANVGQYKFDGDRQSVREQATAEALRIVLRHLRSSRG